MNSRELLLYCNVLRRSSLLLNEYFIEQQDELLDYLGSPSGTDDDIIDHVRVDIESLIEIYQSIKGHIQSIGRLHQYRNFLDYSRIIDADPFTSLSKMYFMFYQKAFYEAKIDATILTHQKDYQMLKDKFHNPDYKNYEIWKLISPHISKEYISTLTDFYYKANTLAEFFTLIADKYGRDKYKVISNNDNWYDILFMFMWPNSFDEWFHDIYERPIIPYTMSEESGIFDLLEIIKGQEYISVVETDFGEFTLQIKMSREYNEVLIKLGGNIGKVCFLLAIENNRIRASSLETLFGGCERNGLEIRGDKTIKLIDLGLTIAKNLYNRPYETRALLRHIRKKLSGLEEIETQLERMAQSGGRRMSRRRRRRRCAYRRSRNSSSI